MTIVLSLPALAQSQVGDSATPVAGKNKVLVLELKNGNKIYWASEVLPQVINDNGNIVITYSGDQNMTYSIGEIAAFYPSDDESLSIDMTTLDANTIVIDGLTVYFQGNGCLYNMAGAKVAEGSGQLTVARGGVYILVNSQSTKKIILQ